MGRRRKLENRDAILRSSYRLFMNRGYDNVSAHDIERDSGINTRNFYRYFKSKDEILGTLICSIEKKMLEYLEPMLTEDSLFTFVLFSVMKHEFSLLNPDYFRMRASLIERPDTFIKSFMELYAISCLREPDWQSDWRAMRQGLYILGGTLIVQYGFIKNFTGNIISEESADFMTNYTSQAMQESDAETYRRFMNYAICNNLYVLGLPKDKTQNLLNDAYAAIETVDLASFRRFYEDELGFN